MIIDILSWVCLIAGGLLGIIGGIGMHRFPDFYSRTHAAGITDTLCAMLILACRPVSAWRHSNSR
jgi:multicomponent Na+:H+ antiporter subunit G